MQKEIILSHVIDYLKLKNIEYKKAGNVVMIKCPLCENNLKSANLIPNTYFINCFHCKQKYTILDIAKKKFKLSGSENEILHKIKEELNLNIQSTIDEENIEKHLKFYEENGFDLVPIVKNKKIPAEKDWTNQEHKDILEWRSWIANGLNIGIKTGLKSNTTILDIDQKPIPEEIKKIMGDTLIQESNNGFHLIYKYEENLPKTRLDSLKIDLENNGGQVVCYPSVIDGVKRDFLKLKEVSKMPKELKEFLISKITIPKKTYSEKLKQDIITENFNLGLLGKGHRNSTLIKLGGIIRKELNLNQTSKVLNILNRHLCDMPLSYNEIIAMTRSLDRYAGFDEQELANDIIHYLKESDSATKSEIEVAITGNRAKGEDKKRLDKILSYLIKEEKIIRKNRFYYIIEEMEWDDKLINIGNSISFRVPYFYDYANFKVSDLIIVGSRNKFGKTTLSMNFIKQLVDQGIKPDYIYNETGCRFSQTALKLGMKDGDFNHVFCSDPEKVIFKKGAITIFDWVRPNDFARTDRLFSDFAEKMNKTKGFLICFVQLRKNNEFFAPDQIGQFPTLLSKYYYENENEGTITKFQITDIRDPKLKGKQFMIPCRYFWDSKEVKRISDLEEGKNNEKDDSN